MPVRDRGWKICECIYRIQESNQILFNSDIRFDQAKNR